MAFDFANYFSKNPRRDEPISLLELGTKFDPISLISSDDSAPPTPFYDTVMSDASSPGVTFVEERFLSPPSSDVEIVPPRPPKKKKKIPVIKDVSPEIGHVSQIDPTPPPREFYIKSAADVKKNNNLKGKPFRGETPHKQGIREFIDDISKTANTLINASAMSPEQRYEMALDLISEYTSLMAEDRNIPDITIEYLENLVERGPSYHHIHYIANDIIDGAQKLDAPYKQEFFKIILFVLNEKLFEHFIKLKLGKTKQDLIDYCKNKGVAYD